MNPDKLDKILLSENQIEASSAFLGNVMLRIQAEALHGQEKPFPWIPFAASMVVVTILSIWFFPADSVLHGMIYFSNFVSEWIVASASSTALRSVLLTGYASVVGSLLFIWLSLRLVGADR